jgi:hypothetical protein
MKLSAKIRAEYLDQLLNGSKDAEYRQFETITLTDENGRSRVFNIIVTRPLTNKQAKLIRKKYPNIPWKQDKQIIRLVIKPIKKL